MITEVVGSFNQAIRFSAVMSLNAGDTMGIGIEVEDVDWQAKPSMEIPFIPEIHKAATKVFEVSTQLYSEISSHCPLKLWKDRLMAVWGEKIKYSNDYDF